MASPADSLSTKSDAELLRLVQQPAAHPPALVAAAQQELQRRGAAPTPPDDFNSYEAEAPSRRGSILLGLALLVLVGLGYAWYRHQASSPAAALPPRAQSPDSLKLETAVATPLPKFDVESPILRQLALLPPAERSLAGQPMRQYQALTRRFWLAQYSSDYLIKQAQHGSPNLPVFAQQLATIQSHWRVLREGLSQYGPFPPGMTEHLRRMKAVEGIEQAALDSLQADCARQQPPHLGAPAQVAQQQVQSLLAPLRRQPGPISVDLR